MPQFPPINQRAIFGCPYGTEKIGFHSSAQSFVELLDVGVNQYHDGNCRFSISLSGFRLLRLWFRYNHTFFQESGYRRAFCFLK